MATAAMMVGGAVVNALAFSGSNYMFSQLSSNDMARHNKAMEDLAKAKEEYEKRRLERLDYINNRLKQEGHAKETFYDVERAMDAYYQVTGQTLDSLGSEPTIDEFYQPTNKEKITEYALILASICGVYYIAKQFKTHK